VALVFLVAAVAGAAAFLLVGSPLRETVAGLGGDGDAAATSAQVLTPQVVEVDRPEETSVPIADVEGEEPSAEPSAEASDADPLREGLRSAVQELVDLRAAAWEATDPGLLAGALAEDSPAMAWEEAELERARAGDLRYDHVAFEVESVEVVEETERGLLVAATVAREPLEARDDRGWLLRAPRQVDTVQLELVREDDRWQLWSWTDEAR
jgi:uncharacterized membrane protein